MNADRPEDARKSAGFSIPRLEPNSSAEVVSSDTPDACCKDGAARTDYSVYRHLHAEPPPLEDCLDSFWSASVPLEDLPEIRLRISEPFEILKRLGPSPFEGGGFPLIGFFATAYERVSRFARQRAGD